MEKHEWLEGKGGHEKCERKSVPTGLQTEARVGQDRAERVDPKGRKGCRASGRALGLPFVQMKHGWT